MALRIAQVFSISEVALGGKLNRVNDPVAGGSVVSGNTVPGGGAPNSQNLRAGVLGFEVELDADTALQLSDTTIGTLFGGVYQYVQVAPASTTVVRGAPAFLTGAASVGSDGIYQVTRDPALAIQGTTSINFLAGVFLNVITPGNFGWIQTFGLASVLFMTGATSLVAGNPINAVVTDGGSFNNGLATATLFTTAVFPTIAGVSRETVVAAAVSRAYLKPFAVRLV